MVWRLDGTGAAAAAARFAEEERAAPGFFDVSAADVRRPHPPAGAAPGVLAAAPPASPRVCTVRVRFGGPAAGELLLQAEFGGAELVSELLALVAESVHESGGFELLDCAERPPKLLGGARAGGTLAAAGLCPTALLLCRRAGGAVPCALRTDLAAGAKPLPTAH